MKKILTTLVFLLPAIGLAEYHTPVEYGVAATITFDLYNADGTLDVDESDSGSDVTIRCGASGVTSTNDYVDRGAYYSIDLTATEMQCGTVVLEVNATVDSNIHIPTWGTDSGSQFVLDGPGDVADAVRTEPCGTETADTIGDLICNDVEATLAAVGSPSDLGSGSTLAFNASDINSFLAVSQADLDTITGSNGVLVADNAITASKIATDAIGSSEIAANAIGSSELTDGAITAPKIATDAITAQKIAANAIGASEIATDAIGSAELAASASTELNAAILALLAIAEPSAVPGFGGDIGDAVSWLLALSRNEIRQTGTTKSLRNDANNANIATCSVSDDGTTFTRSECN